MITSEQLFTEDFVPEWMTRKQRLALESLEQALVVSSNFNYRESAAESRLRIAARCDGRGNYVNTPAKVNNPGCTRSHPRRERRRAARGTRRSSTLTSRT